MENNDFKRIVLKKETVSNLNENQMNILWGRERNISNQTQYGDNCDSANQCCTMFADCNTLTCGNTCADTCANSCNGTCANSCNGSCTPCCNGTSGSLPETNNETCYWTCQYCNG